MSRVFHLLTAPGQPMTHFVGKLTDRLAPQGKVRTSKFTYAVEPVTKMMPVQLCVGIELYYRCESPLGKSSATKVNIFPQKSLPCFEELDYKRAIKKHRLSVSPSSVMLTQQPVIQLTA